MSEIKPGTRVRIRGTEETAIVVVVQERKVCVEGPDAAWIVPPGALEVLSPPLPPEPPVGSYVLRYIDDVTSPDIYELVPPLKRFPREAGLNQGWWCVTNAQDTLISWADLHKDGATVVRLYRADEQPQERYERATSVNGFASWMHSCGRVTGLNLAPEPDPYRSEMPWRWCVDPNCRDEGPWTPLYRRSSDGD